MFKTIAFITIALLSTSNLFSYSPLFKQLIESDEKVDSVSHTITKKKVYSYFIVGLNEQLGTYTTEDITNFSGELVKQRLTKENVPSSDITRPHKVWSKLIKYNMGKVTYVHVSRYISGSYAVKTDKTYMVNASGNMKKQKDVTKEHHVHGYEKPSKFKVFSHNRKYAY